MIISLVIPDEIANGSNPLVLPEGLNPTDSLMEITCQVCFLPSLVSLIYLWIFR